MSLPGWAQSGRHLGDPACSAYFFKKDYFTEVLPI